MSRIYCQICKFPSTSCLCESIQTLTLPSRIIILQHPREIKHAKNTARLAKLVDTNIELVDVKKHELVKTLLLSLQADKTILLYPNANSKALESLVADKTTEIESWNTLVLLDGTWRQVYGIYQQFNSLKNLSHYHFSQPPTKNYLIRKSKKQNQLSTIEALSYAMSVLHGIDTSPFNNILKARCSLWDVK